MTQFNFDPVREIVFPADFNPVQFSELSKVDWLKRKRKRIKYTFSLSDARNISAREETDLVTCLKNKFINPNLESHKPQLNQQREVSEQFRGSRYPYHNSRIRADVKLQECWDGTGSAHA
ncbi:hypothetical protein AVEN_230397-1 [Araneus ventricosus]|uniref:Uncharacterized protein n=1 Tax=Araneus ventricosus TaxID=182803 RepID=A0A4Y2TN87_ARAVE|nr:hypothetical protein AVEN_230397-1 [Araneus ventricosus]